MRELRYYISIITCFFLLHAKAQQKKPGNTVINTNEQATLLEGQYTLNDSLEFFKGICKNNQIAITSIMDLLPAHTKLFTGDQSFLQVHGNILYNFSYRSYIDTPFAQSDLVQHLVQTNFNFLVKDKYPVKMTLTNRSSNSPYFKNYLDINLQYNQQQLLNNIKAKMMAEAVERIDYRELDLSAKKLFDLKSRSKELQSWLSSPMVMQQLVAEKERRMRDSLANRLKREQYNKEEIEKKIKVDEDSLVTELTAWNSGLLDSLNNFSKQGISKALPGNNLSFLKQKKQASLKDLADSNKLSYSKLPAIDSNVTEKYAQRKKQLEELRTKIRDAEATVNLTRKKIYDSVNAIKNSINRINGKDSLYAFIKKNKTAQPGLSKAQQFLLSINQIGIGRSWVDYSELTVKNVSLTGFNIEANPGRLYFAAAAGSINYRFRDFIYKNDVQLPNQQLYLVRLGIGRKESNNIIATIYNGKKQVFNSLSDSGKNQLQNLIGLSIEAKMVLNKHNYLVGEVAKSSYLTNPAEPQNNSQLIHKVFNLSTHQNEAYSIKFFSDYPSTKIAAFYKKAGQYFQSFNLYPVNINQDAWMVKVSQKLWKKQLTVDASVKQNDFVNPVTAPEISNKTIFKSLQVSLKVPKYPFVSIGYYPSSQLSIVNGNRLQEQQYNTFNTIVNYTYRVHNTAMNTSMVFTKFYNNSTDTGFIYFNAASLLATQEIFLSRFTFTSSAGLTSQRDLHLFTLEQQLNYQVTKNLSVTGGFKWNRLNHTETLIGGNGAIGLFIKNIGTLQFQYEKTYLPGSSRLLLPVDIGRMSFYREF